MAKKKVQMTANQREYSKQVKRLKNAVRRLEKQGYRFEEINIPNMPKRVTQKAINEIKAIKPKDLTVKANWLDRETGELVPAQEKRKQDYKERARKAQETRKRKKQKGGQTTGEAAGGNGSDQGGSGYYPDFDEIVINNFLVGVSALGRNVESLINEWLGKVRAKFGDADTAEMLQRGAEAGVVLTFAIAYNRELFQGYIQDMLNYLPDGGEMFTEDLMEALEEMEEWNSFKN